MTYAGYVFDLDGTLFRGDTVIPGAPETVAELRRRGAKIYFLTNNSSQTRDAYMAKLAHMGFEPQPEEIMSTAIGAAAYLTSEGLRSAYVVGEPGLVSTLRDAGIEITDDRPEATVVGICKSFDYAMLNAAMQAIRGGSRFVATNRDSTYPLEGGKFIPGSGSIVAAVATAAGTEPMVIGKPNPFLLQEILRTSRLQESDVLVVGDRLDTDIECGIRAGCPTWLVLTGVESSLPEGQLGSQDVTGLLETD